MKRHTGYGTFDLTRHVAKRIQLEWDMVEQPARTTRFLNFPFAETAARRPLRPLRAGPVEKRPLAA